MGSRLVGTDAVVADMGAVVLQTNERIALAHSVVRRIFLVVRSLVPVALLTLAVACQATVQEEGMEVFAEVDNGDETRDADIAGVADEGNDFDDGELTSAECTLEDVEPTNGQFVFEPPTNTIRFTAPVYKVG